MEGGKLSTALGVVDAVVDAVVGAAEGPPAATAAGAAELLSLPSCANDDEAMSSSLEVAASSLRIIEVSTPSGFFSPAGRGPMDRLSGSVMVDLLVGREGWRLEA
jgi:hypothetical protein